MPVPPLFARSRRVALLSFALIPALLACGDTVVVNVGDNLQELVDANPPGTTYRIKAGLHRRQSVRAKAGDTYDGEPGAVLSGAVVLDGWESEAPWWVYDGPVPEVIPEADPDAHCYSLECAYPRELFRDGAKLQRVFSKFALVSDDRWYFEVETRKTYLSFDPAGRLIEMSGGLQFAIMAIDPQNEWVANVTIRDLIIEKYGTVAQQAAVYVSDGGLLENCEVRDQHGVGASVLGAGTVRHCWLHRNGQLGLGGTGDGALIESNEISHNAGGGYSYSWEMAGVKISTASNWTFRDNYVHHNIGSGLWNDIDSRDIIYERNILEDNGHQGIQFEISCGGLISQNVFRHNGLERQFFWGGGVVVQGSRDVTITGNYCQTHQEPDEPVHSLTGMTGINQFHRGSGECGVHAIYRMHALGNVIVMPNGGENGLNYGAYGWDGYAGFLAADNRVENNTYYLGKPISTAWRWWVDGFEPETYESTQYFYTEWPASGHEPGLAIETRPAAFFLDESNLVPIINAAVGFDYPAAKARLTHARTPADAARDSDGDGIPDYWEIQYNLRPYRADANLDSDIDTLSNLTEFENNTHPRRRDSDLDIMGDAWELAHGFDPLRFNGDSDTDADGVTDAEEFEDSTDPRVAADLPTTLPEEVIAVWLRSDAGLTATPEGSVTEWQDTSGRNHLSNIWLFAETPTLIESATRPPMVDLSTVGQASWLLNPVGGADGITVLGVFQPTAIDLAYADRALLSMETYLNAGFRAHVRSGVLHLHSIQGGGSVQMEGHSPLEAGRTYLLSLVHRGPQYRTVLYLDGVEYASAPAGQIKGGAKAFLLSMLGGVASQPASWGEVMVFNRGLTHLERRGMEKYLHERWMGAGGPVTNRDLDALPDEWEAAHGLDPMIPDGLLDADADGLVNRDELDLDLDPQDPDSDDDVLPDGWEVAHGSNPSVPDAEVDADGDLLSAIEEFLGGTDPQLIDPPPPSIPFPQVGFWIKGGQRWQTNPAGSILQWMDTLDGPTAESVPGRPLPTVSVSAMEGVPAAAFGPGQLRVRGDANDPLVSGPGGFDVFAVVRFRSLPASGDAVALMSTGSSIADFRLGIRNGRIAAWSGTAGADAWQLVSSIPLTAGSIHVLSWHQGEAPIPRLLADNGTTQMISRTDVGQPAPGGVRIGSDGILPAAALDISEVIVFPSALSFTDRRLVESQLLAKYRIGGQLTGDRDGDGLPDWWEYEFAALPMADDAALDRDSDGLSLLQAFQAGVPGLVWRDEDHDRMLDTWESAHGLNPALDDSLADADGDGFNNLVEFTCGSNPQSFVGPPPLAAAFAPERSGVEFNYCRSRLAWRTQLLAAESPDLAPASWIGIGGVPEVASAGLDGTDVLRHFFAPATPESQSLNRRFFSLRIFSSP